MKLTSVIRILIALPLCIITNQHILAQGFLHADGQKIVDGNGHEIILKGMGLGGWMLQEGYMMTTAGSAPTQHELKKKIADLIGQEGMEEFYNAWLNNHVQKTDIDSLASWGFNSVRLPMHYNLYTLPIEQEPVSGENTWLEKGFALTDSLLKWCEDNQMYLILDLHAAPGGQGYDAAISDYDDTKPSLWESALNREKTVALWQKLAERYAEKEWIGGYDLINETNWNMNNNQLLRGLYGDIVQAIRLIDNNHLIFIEGNWFANDFTGLTPPFDENMAYSFHKYWSYNNQAAIQKFLDLRETYNVPIWLGESGENSNTWFRDCIKLMRTHNIGWAWWPMKKIESISGLLSITRNSGYARIIDYWDGNGPKPSAAEATAALMQLAEDTKIQHCRYNKDVVHAMFQEVEGDHVMPYTDNLIPGIIYVTDYDIGPAGVAYFDQNVANYHISSNNYIAYNEGWSYRNDGMDIQKCDDTQNTNGYNVGWFEGGEWMKYTVYVEKSGYYTADVRVASESGGGKFHFELDGEAIGNAVVVEATGGWQAWKTVKVSRMFMEEGVHTLKLVSDLPGNNISSFDFKFLSVSSVEDKPIPNEVVVYPNPGNGKIWIRTDLSFSEYALFDRNGAKIKSGKLENVGQHVSLDISTFPEGMYVLYLNDKINSTVQKILIK